jgi:hypothetical protein
MQEQLEGDMGYIKLETHWKRQITDDKERDTSGWGTQGKKRETAAVLMRQDISGQVTRGRTRRDVGNKWRQPEGQEIQDDDDDDEKSGHADPRMNVGAKHV